MLVFVLLSQQRNIYIHQRNILVDYLTWEVKEDNYGGIILDVLSDEAIDTSIFSNKLSTSLTSWRSSGKRGVWLQLPTSQSHLIPTALNFGFVYHHARQEYLMMTVWLPTDEPSTLPSQSHHQVCFPGNCFPV